MTGKNFGFGKLADIKPDTESGSGISDDKIDEIGQRHGFIAREPVQKLTRRKPAEPSANLNIRPSITTFNRFLQFCEQNRMSYPEGLKELMDRAGV
ncbi:hypothetical protein NOI24_11280 [Neorhizobium galegae]|uniref:hypothetical protein n=1 Tax=Neorhizobium galegae TaxID=399 RepID=UPI0021031928|nr:hypothetical protein [Neorhizobium galegae]MCQ1771885.1 hypothetical protein [Neorhizobium galegae]MCQ1800069.1 hypothetical protein [Neorhizobium galegae]